MANLRRPTREVRIWILGMWTVPYPKINISLASFRRASGSGGWVGLIIPFRPEHPNGQGGLRVKTDDPPSYIYVFLKGVPLGFAQSEMSAL